MWIHWHNLRILWAFGLFAVERQEVEGQAPLASACRPVVVFLAMQVEEVLLLRDNTSEALSFQQSIKMLLPTLGLD